LEPEEPANKKRRKGLLWSEFDEFDLIEGKSAADKQENTILEKKKTEQNGTSVEETSTQEISTSQETIAAPPSKEEEPAFDLNSFQSVEELEKLGLEKLKEELQKLGLLCGGNLKQRAQRLFSVKGKSKAEIDSKLFAKKGKK